MVFSFYFFFFFFFLKFFKSYFKSDNDVAGKSKSFMFVRFDIKHFLLKKKVIFFVL
jgi:hypothetical protein